MTARVVLVALLFGGCSSRSFCGMNEDERAAAQQRMIEAAKMCACGVETATADFNGMPEIRCRLCPTSH